MVLIHIENIQLGFRESKATVRLNIHDEIPIYAIITLRASKANFFLTTKCIPVK
jgi:hypothetical protein